jgi:hypothetical protein
VLNKDGGLIKKKLLLKKQKTCAVLNKEAAPCTGTLIRYRNNPLTLLAFLTYINIF